MKIKIKSIYILVFLGITWSSLGEVLGEKNKKPTFFQEFSIKNEEKKIRKEIARKIYSEKFNKIMNELSLKEIRTVNYLTNRETIKKALNSKNGEKELSKINNSDVGVAVAEEILIVSRELKELEEVSLEIKNYLREKYINFDYNYFAKEGDKIIKFIRDKETLYELLPETMKKISKNLPPKIAENIKEILKGKKISKEVKVTTKDFTNLELSSKEMEEVYEFSIKLKKLGDLVNDFQLEINKLYPQLDYTEISKNGIFYIMDKKTIEQLNDEYEKGNYTFESPYIKINPYNRVINMAYIKYPNSVNEKVNVKIKNRNKLEDFEYIQENKEYIEIYGLYMNNTENIIELDNGKSKVELKIISPLLPNKMPSIVVRNINENEYTKGMTYFTYLYGKEASGIIFDKEGEIRYIFDPSLEDNERIWKILKKENSFFYYNNDRVLEFSISGKILNNWDRKRYESEVSILEEGNKTNLDIDSQLLKDNKKTLNTVGFINKKYPMGKIVEINLENNQEIFEANIFLKNNDRKKNKIMNAERINFQN
ncbi:MAG: hypothetical protein ACRC0S_03220 [Fusobacteriaceae bacterium]